MNQFQHRYNDVDNRTILCLTCAIGEQNSFLDLGGCLATDYDDDDEIGFSRCFSFATRIQSAFDRFDGSESASGVVL